MTGREQNPYAEGSAAHAWWEVERAAGEIGRAILQVWMDLARAALKRGTRR